jgi:hypothetical protein
VTLRSPWLLCGWLLGLGGVLVGLATASSGDPVGLLLGVAVAAGSGWVVVRVPFMRVQATAAGLTNHGLFRRRHVSGEKVLSIEFEQTDDKVVGQVYAPVVRLRDGGEVLLTQLSGYSTSKRVAHGRVGRQTDCLRRAMTGS